MPAAKQTQGKATTKATTAKPAKPRAATNGKRELKFGKSKVESPVAVAWEAFNKIYTKDPETSRKDAIQAAVEAGVNPATARTQFQRWSSAAVEE